ncbi:MAG: DegQ family serine endoprotease [Candidatus Binatia bacterium]
MHPHKAPRHPWLITGVLLINLLLWRTSPLLARDWFGAEKADTPSPALTGGGNQLPSFAGIAQKASPAVINIATAQKAIKRRRQPPFHPPGRSPFGEDDPFEEFFRHFFGDRPPRGQQRSLGSGFLISTDGYIMTNTHVIGDADKITVRLSNNEEYTAKVIGADDKTDIALIKINPQHPVPILALGSSATLQVGDWVVAIGNPFGLEQTVTAGIVSAKGRVIGAGPYDDFIQTDASINPGNSGGPLLNLNGEVVGINSAIFSQSGGNIGIGFAIPIDLAKSIVTQLKASGKVTRGWLGVAIQDVTPELATSFGLTEPTGALVADVTKDGPADKAGLKRGDVITAFLGTPITAAHDLPALVAQSPVGEKAEVTVLRDGKEKTLTVTLGELTDQRASAEGGAESGANWGLTVANLTPETTRRFDLDPDEPGVVITDVDSGSPADDAGLQPGDVIQEVNRRAITSVDDFTTAVKATTPKDTLLLLVRRQEGVLFFALHQAG